MTKKELNIRTDVFIDTTTNSVTSDSAVDSLDALASMCEQIIKTGKDVSYSLCNLVEIVYGFEKRTSSIGEFFDGVGEDITDTNILGTAKFPRVGDLILVNNINIGRFYMLVNTADEVNDSITGWVSFENGDDTHMYNHYKLRGTISYSHRIELFIHLPSITLNDDSDEEFLIPPFNDTPTVAEPGSEYVIMSPKTYNTIRNANSSGLHGEIKLANAIISRFVPDGEILRLSKEKVKDLVQEIDNRENYLSVTPVDKDAKIEGTVVDLDSLFSKD